MKKAVSMLLALVMCMGLALPVYAEEPEETPVSQETGETEALPPEEGLALPELSGKGETEPGAVEQFGISEGISYDHIYLIENEAEDATLYGQLVNDLAVSDPALSASADGEINSASDSHEHVLEILSTKTYWQTDSSGHRWVTETKVRCTVSGCGSEATLYDYDPQEGEDFDPTEEVTDLSEEADPAEAMTDLPEEAVTEEEPRTENEAGFVPYSVDPADYWVLVGDEDGDDVNGGAEAVYPFATDPGDEGISPAAIHPLPHKMKIIEETSHYETNGSSHRVVVVRVMECTYSGCDYKLTEEDPDAWESHSWKQKSITYSKRDSSNHNAVYQNECSVCGETEKETKVESHSLTKVDFTNHYHKGKLHYIEWDCECTLCHYTTTKLESFSCPGNNNGEGCVIPITKEEPPVEVESAGPAEEMTDLPEETDAPAEEMTDQPEEVDVPEADIPLAEAPTLLPEEVPTLPDLSGEWESGEPVYGHLHLLEAKPCNEIGENGEILVSVQYGFFCTCSDPSAPADPSMMPLNGTSGNDPLSDDIFSVFSAQATLDNCPICGQNNWYGKPQDAPYACVDDGDSSTHEAHYLVPMTCQTPGCISAKWNEITKRESHSWDKKSVTYSKRDSSDHNAAYQYECGACGKTKRETKVESHSLTKVDFTNHYHKGKLHYIEWNCKCTLCNYTTTKLESFSCPGNNAGEGCVIPITKEEPPVEAESTEPVEDMTDAETPERSEEINPIEEANVPEATAPEEPEPLQGETVVTLGNVTFSWAGEKIVDSIATDVDQQMTLGVNDTVSGSIVPPVKDHTHHVVIYEQKTKYNKDDDQHQEVIIRYWKCADTTCGYKTSDELPGNPVSHSWKKGSFNSYETNALTHTAVYNYSCSVCGYTKTQAESAESHSWDEIGTGTYNCQGSDHTLTRNYKCKCGETKTETTSLMKCVGYTGDNYHRAKLHYVGYGYYCTVCGYSETRYESMSCPGNNNGEGCIFFITHQTEPPVEVESADPVEEMTDLPEETVPPEDVTVPGPGETDQPEEEAGEPEDTDGSGVVYVPVVYLPESEEEMSAAYAAAANHICMLSYTEEDFVGYSIKKIEGDDQQHRVFRKYNARCSAPSCEVFGVVNVPTGVEAHSWIKGDPTGKTSGDGSGHSTEYAYKCRCGATKTEWETEAHSFKKTGSGTYESVNKTAHSFTAYYMCQCGVNKTVKETEDHSFRKVGHTGNHYHKGSKHYVEYEYECIKCGYTKTMWGSYDCPGPTGGGCILPDTPINKEEPPVEVEDIGPAEEMTDLPEETAPPGEAALPEEPTDPEESAAPEETVLPEDTDLPDGPERTE